MSEIGIGMIGIGMIGTLVPVIFIEGKRLVYWLEHDYMTYDSRYGEYILNEDYEGNPCMSVERMQKHAKALKHQTMVITAAVLFLDLSAIIVEARDIMENGVCLCVYAFFQFILLFIAILRNKAYNEQIRQIVIAEVMAT